MYAMFSFKSYDSWFQNTDKNWMQMNFSQFHMIMINIKKCYKTVAIGIPIAFHQAVLTVVLKRESKWHDLWSKWPIPDLVFYNIKMPPCSCPLGSSLLLTGALKWGTVQTSTSTYTGIMKGQT